MRITTLAVFGLLALCCGLAVQAGELDGTRPSDSVREIDLFDAMEQQWVDVKFIPVGSHRANVIIRNETAQPLHLVLPPTFGAVHVLGQFGAGGGGNAGIGFGGGGGPQGGGNNGGGQGVGGGFGVGAGGGNFAGAGQGNGNFGIGNNGGGNLGAPAGRGFFRVEPQKPRKLSVDTVCLEHGKADPNSRMKYQLVSLASVNSLPEVEQLCRQLGRSQVAQPVAQAAAWHLANNLSWERLSSLNRVESFYTGNERYFTASQLRDAVEFAGLCLKSTRLKTSSLSLADPSQNPLSQP